MKEPLGSFLVCNETFRGVVSSKLLPKACIEDKNITTIGVILGFVVMIILDGDLG